MVEIAVILTLIVAFAGGLGLMRIQHARQAKAVRAASRPNPRAVPATQTADVKAKAGSDPAARL